MRRVLVLTAAVLALTACQKREETAETPDATASASASAGAQAGGDAAAGPPVRKPGLWTQTVNAAGTTQRSEICIDAASDRKLSLFGQQAGGQACSTATTRTPEGMRFKSTCDMGSGGKTTSTGTVAGDFEDRYVVTATTTTSGAAAPQMNGEHPMTLVAEWEGPCPEGMRPGDMRLPGGVTVNLLEMAG